METRVAELFAGVGGFRLGLERSSGSGSGVGWKVVWSNQWEPATRAQLASDCYVTQFGPDGHVCEDIHVVMDEAEAGRLELPDHDLLVGGFPCQDYSVARTLDQAVGIKGRRGVLWWEIHRLLVMKRPPMILLENVDRLLKSPARQRGRDFAVMLATLADLGYEVEWRVINAAEYGFPQKRRRVFLVGRLADAEPRHPQSVLYAGVLARALPVLPGPRMLVDLPTFEVLGSEVDITERFGVAKGETPFRNAGYMSHRRVWTLDLVSEWEGPFLTLGDTLDPPESIPGEFFVPSTQLKSWAYLKGAKRERRYHKGTGTPYFYAEGAIPFPDRMDGPARTILTGEGGTTPSRFKHIVELANGRFRRLTPEELERLNGFPSGWTDTGMSPGRRAFMMGNALVVGLVERISTELLGDALEGVTDKSVAVPVGLPSDLASEGHQATLSACS